MYAIYHGPDGLKRIANRVHDAALLLAEGKRALPWVVIVIVALFSFRTGLKSEGHTVRNKRFFDSLKIKPKVGVETIRKRAEAKEINLRYFEDGEHVRPLALSGRRYLFTLMRLVQDWRVNR